MTKFLYTILLIFSFIFSAFGQKIDSKKPTLFCVGDSTVNNSGEGMKGWGNVIDELFNDKINVVNRARGGRSSRTFYTEGLWQKVVDELKSGDFVLIQFGHNDGGPIDKEKFRGSIRGIGDEKQDITGQNGQPETIYTFGWYLRKFVADVRAKKATVILLSPVPRNQWKDGKVKRENESYGKWSREVAEKEKVFFLDLNEITALKYEKETPEVIVKTYFTPKDNTHTSEAGAKMNAQSVVEGLKKLKGNPLKKYLK
jgi:rhamnogalacturonan acetylesterase